MEWNLRLYVSISVFQFEVLSICYYESYLREDNSTSTGTQPTISSLSPEFQATLTEVTVWWKLEGVFGDPNEAQLQ